MEIVFLVFWFFGDDFEFCEFLGRLFVGALFGSTPDIHNKRMRSLAIMHRGVLMQRILWIVTRSIEASETHINSIRTILKLAMDAADAAGEAGNEGREED
jgi:hypothetical protein